MAYECIKIRGHECDGCGQCNNSSEISHDDLKEIEIEEKAEQDRQDKVFGFGE